MERPDQWYQDALERKRRRAETVESLQLVGAILINLVVYGGIVAVVIMAIMALAKYIGLWGGF